MDPTALALWLPVVLVLGPLLALLAWVGVTHLRFVTYARHTSLKVRRATVGEHVRAYLREVLAMLIAAAWHVVAFGRDGLRTPEQVTGRPVLCVHGFTQNGTNFWGIRRALEARGRPTRAVSMGLPFRRFEAYAPRLERALREMIDLEPHGVDVICHSLGGLILRRVLGDHPELARGVHTIVTLGSPHHGTAIARGFFMDSEVRQMRRRRGEWSELPSFADSAPHARVVTVAGDRDYICYPHDTCHLPRADERVDLDGLGHAGLLTLPVAVEAAVRAIAGQREMVTAG